MYCEKVNMDIIDAEVAHLKYLIRTQTLKNFEFLKFYICTFDQIMGTWKSGRILRVGPSQTGHHKHFANHSGFEGLCLETQYGDPLPAELIEQFNIFDMSIEQEDGESALSSQAYTSNMRERRKSDFNRISLRRRSTMPNVHAPIRELNEL